MAATIDQNIRTAVTDRITAHVRHGWPHLGDPIITFRGPFCYVAVANTTRTRWLRRPRPAPPSPTLRLRYQGHPDTWKIGIYLHSTETYTEAELPNSFGPITATPEDGVDQTFPLYYGPNRRNQQHNTTDSSHHSE